VTATRMETESRDGREGMSPSATDRQTPRGERETTMTKKTDVKTCEVCGRPATVESEAWGFPTCRGCDEAARDEGTETR
jgi:ribosomal protein L37AE/L43A